VPLVLAVETADREGFVGKLGARGGSGLITAVRAIAVVIVHVLVGDGNVWVCEAGKGFFIGWDIEFCICSPQINIIPSPSPLFALS